MSSPSRDASNGGDSGDQNRGGKQNRPTITELAPLLKAERAKLQSMASEIPNTMKLLDEAIIKATVAALNAQASAHASAQAQAQAQETARAAPPPPPDHPPPPGSSSSPNKHANPAPAPAPVATTAPPTTIASPAVTLPTSSAGLPQTSDAMALAALGMAYGSAGLGGLTSLPDVATIRTETSLVEGKIHHKVFVPIDLKPSYNFVGRLLGHKGATLQSIETETGAKLMIRGKGSVREGKTVPACRYGDKCSRRESCMFRHPDEPEEDGKHLEHLREPLHVLVMASADAAGENAIRIAQAYLEPLMIPDDRIPSSIYDPRARMILEQYRSGMPSGAAANPSYQLDPAAYQAAYAVYQQQLGVGAMGDANSNAASAAASALAQQYYASYSAAPKTSATNARFHPYSESS